MRPATDFGITSDSTADQTDAMRSALEAAAGEGFDLLLPPHAIVCEGPLTHSIYKTSLIGSPGTVLDFRHATFDGPAIVTDGSRTAEQQAPQILSGRLTNLLLLGPTDPDTTVDGIEVAGSASDRVYGIRLDQVTFDGFRTQEILGDHEWLVSHDQCWYNHGVKTAVDFTGSVNSGEMISWSHSGFANGADVVTVSDPAAGLDMAFEACAFDFNTGPVLTASTGTFGFANCHFEWGKVAGDRAWDSRPNLVELTSSTDRCRTPTVHFTGGEVILQGDYCGSTPLDVAVVQTITSANQPPIVVTADGLTVRNFASRHDLMLLEFHREAALTDKSSASYPQVGFGGHLSFRAPGYTAARVGEACSLVVDGGFEGSLSTSSAIGEGVGAGWQTGDGEHVSLDVAARHSGSQSVRVSYADAPPDGVPLRQQIILTPGRTYHCSFWYRTDSLTVGDTCRIEVRHHSPNGDRLGTNASRALRGGTNDWQFMGFWFRVPSGAAISVPCLFLDNSSGTVWLDEVQLSPC